MRVITRTRTGAIVSDTELGLEYLYVGDYGKENNIKADFLGYTKRIERVEHHSVDLAEKLVVTVSSQKGCPMACDFCDCPKVGFHSNCSTVELVSEITSGIALSGVKRGKRLNVHFARMGEPTLNPAVVSAANTVASMLNCCNADVSFDTYHPVVSTMMPVANKNLERFLAEWVLAGHEYGDKDGYGLQFSINTLDERARNRAFGGRSLDLASIGQIIDRLPAPKQRKFTLNFAVTSESDLDPVRMGELFNPKRCIVKITPIHETHAATDNGYEIVHDFDVYERFERPLTEAGWDVIVFVPSAEEDEDRITCGNALIAAMK